MIWLDIYIVIAALLLVFCIFNFDEILYKYILKNGRKDSVKVRAVLMLYFIVFCALWPIGIIVSSVIPKPKKDYSDSEINVYLNGKKLNKSFKERVEEKMKENDKD